MKHEKIIKRDNGDRVKISVTFTTTNYSEQQYKWGCEVEVAPNRKRKFENVVNTDDWDYRRQSFPDGRNAWAARKHLEYATADEIHQVKLELWEMLKPVK